MPVIFEPKPNTVEEALERVVSDLEPSEFDFIKKEGIALLHHSLGRAIRNEWGLWDKESKLYKDFRNTLGLWHADDMSGILLEHIECFVKGSKFDMRRKAQYYKDYWMKNYPEDVPGG